MADQYLAYIGTYTTGASEGIYAYRLDAASGALEHLSTTSGVEDPSFLDIAPSGQHLYAVCADFTPRTAAWSKPSPSTRLAVR